MKKVLTIAGSDSGAGAGIQADLKAIAAMGVYGTSAITSITAQNTIGVRQVFNLPISIIEAQVDAVLEDIGADAIKTGMLATGEIISLVARKIKEYHIEKLVVDPVMVATSGDALLEREAVGAIISELIPLAMVVTPNMKEAEILTGLTLESEADMEAAAQKIFAMGPHNVVIKGGHRKEDALDIIYNGREFLYLRGKRVATKNNHGTGCTYSAVMAALLAQGFLPFEAAARAKEYVTAGLENSLDIGKGRGPVDHFYFLDKWPCKMAD
ncbi:MAG: bifunctional hydroxymethylpyrimidine kinase/phosphomethylpyrimidine kinase [Bacillota bacterium]